MISIVHVTNPVQPSVGRETAFVEFIEGKPLAGYLLDRFGAALKMTVSLNGRIMAPERWPSTTLRDGDCIVIAPLVEGGSLLRTIASIAVLAAAAAVSGGLGAGAFAGLAAGPLGALFAGIGLGGLSVTTAAIIGSAIAVGGNLLVGALLGNTPSDKSDSASYDPDGPRSLARSGTVIPKGYGTFRWGGNIISSFTDVEGEDQYINCLVCFGWGPARAITSLQINGKDISNYLNVSYYLRYGTNNQTPIPNFNRIVNGYPQDVQCLAGVPVVVPGTGDLTQALQIDILFPDGAFVETHDGNQIPILITYKVEYSVGGANNWQPIVQPRTTSDVVTYRSDGTVASSPAWVAVATDLPLNSGIVYATSSGGHNAGDPYTATELLVVYNPDGSSYNTSKTVKGEWQPCDPTLNQVLVEDWTAGYVNFSASDRQPLYNRTSIYGLAPNKYDVRVTKYGSNRLHSSVGPGDNNNPNFGQEVWIHSVNEISLLDLAYPNTILVGVRALATNQIDGSSLNITAQITHGLRTLDTGVLPQFLQAYEEDNPACVLADAALDGLYGGGQFPGYTAANILRFADEWTAWADLNDELVDNGSGGSIRRHVFNGVFDSEGSLQDAFNAIGRMSRSAIIPMGKDLGVFVDQPDTPVQIFTMGNILEDSFDETWLDIDSRANQVEISFADSTRYYRQDNPLVYMDPANQDSGAIVKNVRIDGKGVTVPAQAWHLARYKERCNQYLLRTGSFKCDTDAIAARPGNVAILQHDVPQWGYGGRTLPGSTASTLLLDRNDLPFVSGTSYSVVVQHPAREIFVKEILAIAVLPGGNVQLELDTFDNSQRVTRMKLGTVNGIDSLILSSAVNQIVIVPCSGFLAAAAVGLGALLYDTDILETRPVSAVTAGVGGAMATVTLSTPLSQAPYDFSIYFYGPVGTQKLVRIQNIKKASEFRSTIEWIDYSASVYVDAIPTIGETSAQSTSNCAVTTLLGSETFQLVGGTYVDYANLSWRLGPDTVGVGIYAYIVGGNITSGGVPQLLARLTGKPTSWKQQIYAGTTTTYLVVGLDINDNYASIKTAPQVTITALGITANLLLGSSFASGFAYWNLLLRLGDTLVPSFADDGQADYTVAGTALTPPQSFLSQQIPPSKWAVGDWLMLSAYFQAASFSGAGADTLTVTLAFYSATALLGSAVGSCTLTAASNLLVRVNTAITQVPAGTTAVVVFLGVAGSVAVPVGAVMTMSHVLLEIGYAGQTAPSAWADIDVAGHVLNIFESGSSSGLRVQGSVLPTFTGTFSYTATSTTLTIAWTNLIILWPDGMYTYVVDGTIAITGLLVSTAYYAFLYFDIVYGSVKAQAPTTAVGTPAVLSNAYDAMADAACAGDGRVQLTKGGYAMNTAAAGGTGGGGRSNPTPPVPPYQPPGGNRGGDRGD